MICPCCDKPLTMVENIEPACIWPDEIARMSKREQHERCRLTVDVCNVDWDSGDKSQQFIRCVMPFAVHGRERPFHWGVWAAVSREDFLAYIDLCVAEQGGGDVDYDVAWHGTLANEMETGFGSVLGAAVVLKPPPNRQRPHARLVVDQDHRPLVAVQRDGVTLEQTMEWLKPFHAMLVS